MREIVSRRFTRVRLFRYVVTFDSGMAFTFDIRRRDGLEESNR